MKKSLLILFFAQITFYTEVISQSSPVKSSNDACPDWNKKQVTSKADYFKYLSKSNKVKDNSDFNTPKYQSIYTKNTVSPTTTNFGIVSAHETKQSKALITKEVRSSVEEKNNSSRSVRESILAPIEIKKAAETETIEKTNISDPAEEKGKSVEKEGDKKQVEAKKENIKFRHHRKHRFKKIRFKKKKATTCPDF